MTILLYHNGACYADRMSVRVPPRCYSLLLQPVATASSTVAKWTAAELCSAVNMNMNMTCAMQVGYADGCNFGKTITVAAGYNDRCMGGGDCQPTKLTTQTLIPGSYALPPHRPLFLCTARGLLVSRGCIAESSHC